MARRAAPESRQIVTLGDAALPAGAAQTADPPLLLYAQGRCELLHARAVAIVGSRNPTPQGIDNARAFAGHLSQAGLTIVSGLALGIDGAAHEGALDGPGSTIAVVGTGLDRVYPTRHRELAHRIASEGLMVSEFPLGTPPLPPNFPLRNRIIAGLTRGTLVVEAALQSGSLITARLALEAGREVFAIPGSIHSPQSRGCHALIKQGAKLVDGAEDVLEELHVGASAAGRGTPPSHRQRSRRARSAARGARLRSGHAGCAGRPHRLAAAELARGCSSSSSTATSRACPGSCSSAWRTGSERSTARTFGRHFRRPGRDPGV